MVSIADLSERTVGYLRKHVFSDRKTDYVKRNGLLVPEQMVDFESTQKELVTVDRSWVRDRVLSWVRDSEEYVVIDIAAGFGSGYAKQLAEQFPHVQVFLIDMFGHDMEGSVKQSAKYPKDLVFQEYPKIDDPQECMNAMLQRGGYRNIRYIERPLFVGGTGTQFPELDKTTRGRHVLVTGICNPEDISLATAREAAYHGAEECYIVPAGLEYLDPETASLFFQGTNGMLCTEDRNHLFALNCGALYTEPEEQARIALKQAFVLGLAQKLTKHFTPTVYRYTNLRNNYSHRQNILE